MFLTDAHVRLLWRLINAEALRLLVTAEDGPAFSPWCHMLILASSHPFCRLFHIRCAARALFAECKEN
jgi:hypothetical protein